MKKLLDANYVLVTLDVMESPDKKNLETPGGVAVMEKLLGKNAGLPFMAVVNPDGKMLINSNAQKEGTEGNTGYPAQPQEIAWFMKMMTTTAPRLSKDQAMQMQNWLQMHAPKG